MSRGSSATSLDSVQNARKQLTRFLKKIRTVPTEILQEEVPILRSEIIQEIPYETGKLERSVRVAVAKDKKRPGINASASALSKGGYNYAGIQHENEDFRHGKAGAKAHYISDPFERCIKRIEKKMEDRLEVK